MYTIMSMFPLFLILDLQKKLTFKQNNGITSKMFSIKIKKQILLLYRKSSEFQQKNRRKRQNQ